jgi:tRNA modification GTPase
MTPADAPPTIAVLQTPPGRGGIAVIVLAGERAGEILQRCFRPGPSHADAGPGRLQLGHIVDAGLVIDEALVHADLAGAEINIHGGSAAAGEVLALFERLGAVVAPAPADAPGQLPLAHPRWNNPAIGGEMLQALAHAITATATAAVTRQWAAGVSELVSGTPKGEQLREAASGLGRMKSVLSPPEVVLVGAPNAGKSSLMNALVGRGVCIVNQTAGTTRDWVREPAAVGGLPVYLTDTAGLWDAPAGIDAEAVRRAKARAQQADLVLLLAPGGLAPKPVWLQGPKVLRIASQSDLVPPGPGADAAVSAVTGEGLDALRLRILHELGLANFDPGCPMAFTPRQARLLTRMADAVNSRDELAVAEARRELLSGPAVQPRLD